ncbi:UbiA family prenyltransferase [Kosakonia sp. MUSA4]|uniref:UbiA family prenyltransferase n=1 Tax=Kosakonia sp. MUSA4 TaxID=2067958 RepID=UPI001599EC33|nr:UbiA family prenyltransferase [Kosakonia sp. MUSA4]QJT83053.1 prenyltransferase [Kosakonia sp. MUSA4]
MAYGVNSSLFSRVMLWVAERFPLSNAPLFVIIYFLSMTVALAPDVSMNGLHIIIGSILSVSFFLLLRVLDEHKDYQDDCVHHPGRVLQRGLITLRHLKFIGAGCLFLQLAGMALLAPGLSNMLASWGLLLLWTLLMTREFFVPEWLRKHFFVYAVSHTLIMPFIIWWLATLSFPEITLNRPIQLLMLLSFFSGLNFEIMRKCKGPDEDRPEVTTYSQLLGRPLAVLFIICLLVAMALTQYAIIIHIRGSAPVWFYAINIASVVVTLGQLLHFLSVPDQSNRKRNELAVGLSAFIGYLLCIFSVCFS